MNNIVFQHLYTLQSDHHSKSSNHLLVPLSRVMECSWRGWKSLLGPRGGCSMFRRWSSKFEGAWALDECEASIPKRPAETFMWGRNKLLSFKTHCYYGFSVTTECNSETERVWLVIQNFVPMWSAQPAPRQRVGHEDSDVAGWRWWPLLCRGKTLGQIFICPTLKGRPHSNWNERNNRQNVGVGCFSLSLAERELNSAES